MKEQVEAADTLLCMASRADRLRRQLQDISNVYPLGYPSDKSRAVADLDDMACQLRRVARYMVVG